MTLVVRAESEIRDHQAAMEILDRRGLLVSLDLEGRLVLQASLAQLARKDSKGSLAIREMLDRRDLLEVLVILAVLDSLANLVLSARSALLAFRAPLDGQGQPVAWGSPDHRVWSASLEREVILDLLGILDRQVDWVTQDRWASLEIRVQLGYLEKPDSKDNVVGLEPQDLGALKASSERKDSWDLLVPRDSLERLVSLEM